MSTIDKKLQEMINSFDEKNELVTPETAANLRSCIESSPELIEQMNRAVREGHLKSFSLMKDEGIAGGMYQREDGTMLLSAKSLASTPDRTFDIHDMAFVLGHETQHGFNAAERN